jgi:ABC-2 type transport system ATP-binding protein
MSPLLELDRVTRRYGYRTAVAEASLLIEPGCALSVVGENGAGKSTLLALAAGVLRPDAGSVRIAGLAPEETAAARRQVGYMADAPLVYEALTARENLRFFGRLYGLRDFERGIAALLDRVGLADRSDEPTGNFSAGLRRRLDLARVLLHEPALLVLDEPSVSLDREGLALLAAIIAEWRAAGRAVLLTTHDAAAVGGLVDEVAVIERGRLRTTDIRTVGQADRGTSADKGAEP